MSIVGDIEEKLSVIGHLTCIESSAEFSRQITQDLYYDVYDDNSIHSHIILVK